MHPKTHNSFWGKFVVIKIDHCSFLCRYDFWYIENIYEISGTLILVEIHAAS